MSEVHGMDNDGVSGISESDEKKTNFPSISNDMQAGEGKSGESLTEVRSADNTVEQHVSPTSESESYAVIGTDPSRMHDHLSPTKKLNRQGELTLHSSSSVRLSDPSRIQLIMCQCYKFCL